MDMTDIVVTRTKLGTWLQEWQPKLEQKKAFVIEMTTNLQKSKQGKEVCEKVYYGAKENLDKATDDVFGRRRFSPTPKKKSRH